MKNKLLSLATLSTMLVALLVMVVPVGAQSVDQRIQALEAELTRLKTEQQQVKTEQMELKRVATAAQEKMPTFEYDAGDGLTITAADKSWSANISMRVNVHSTIYPDGRSHAFDPVDGLGEEGADVDLGQTSFELAPRRNRFYFNYCWDDCFYQLENAIDGETGTRTAAPRDSELYFRFDQWNAYLPYFSVGVRRGAGTTHLSRSSSSDAKLEHHMILGFGDWGGAGSHGGMGLGWNRVAVGSGDVSLFLNLATSLQGTHADFIDSDRKGLMSFFGVRPFSKTKQKWIQGLEFGVGYQAHSIDKFDGRDVEISGHEERGGQDFFAVDGIGQGWSYVFIPGMKWRIGPYMIRGNWHRTQLEGRDDGFRGVQGTGWNISNQIFLWSPKGFLTGSPSTAGSLLLGFDFERADVECGVLGCNDLDTQGTHKRQTVLNREIGLWYFIKPALRIGTWAHFWQTSNTPDFVQVATGCKKDFTSARSGKGTSRECDWWTANLGIQYQW